MAKKTGKNKQVETNKVKIGRYNVSVAPSESFLERKPQQDQPRRQTSGDRRFDQGFAAAYLATKAAVARSTLPPPPTDLTKDWVIAVDRGTNTPKWEEKPKGYYDLVHGTAELATLDGATHPEGELVYDIDNKRFWMRNANARSASLNDWDYVPALSLPTDQTILRSLDFDPNLPAGSQIAWEDARDRLITVGTLADLDTIPDSHIQEGKMVYVRSERMIYEYTTTVALRSHTLNDWTPLIQGLDFYARFGDLPTQHLIVGQQAVVRLDLAGNNYGRLVVYEGAANGWRYVNVRNFLKAQRATPDQPTDTVQGDIQITTERDHKEIKVYDGTNWQPVLGEDQIKGWIAALSLFEGTAQEVGGGNPGALELDGMPALSVAKTGHYYTWVGTSNYNVTATTPGIGADLAGAILNPGDWLQQANRGTTATPDMHWVVVGGDLLAKSRGDNLYGMQIWADGAWETGSLVLYEGQLYRATQGVAATDTVPGVIVAGSVTGRASTELQATTQARVDAALANNAPDGSNTGKWWQTNLGADYTPTSGPLNGVNIPDGSAVMNLGDPTLGTNGWAVIAPPFPVGVPTFGASPNKWSLVNVGGTAINFYTTDGDRPARGSTGQIILVLSSARAQGKPVLFTWDQAQNQWAMLGGAGGGGTAIRDMTGDKLINVGLPVGSITAYGGIVLPDGWLWCDGAAFDGTAYAELVTVLGRATTPDLTGHFIRGAADMTAFDQSFPQNRWTTGMPRAPFGADDGGWHSHSIQTYYNDVVSGSFMNSFTTNVHTEQLRTNSTLFSGNHNHSIIGGDPETAPDHVIMGYIIKASEKAKEVVPAP